MSLTLVARLLLVFGLPMAILVSEIALSVLESSSNVQVLFVDKSDKNILKLNIELQKEETIIIEIEIS